MITIISLENIPRLIEPQSLYLTNTNGSSPSLHAAVWNLKLFERIQQIFGLISVDALCVMQLMFMWYMESEWKGVLCMSTVYPFPTPCDPRRL